MRPEHRWQRPRAGLIGLARLHLSIDGDDLAERLLSPPYRMFLILAARSAFVSTYGWELEAGRQWVWRPGSRDWASAWMR